ncbi:cyclic nucleotide-binding domain-containing protein [Myxococcota bacterium]|nr:cyclic nucleotide-binding domain-containing protein [Myxococcota bacterium]
MSRADLPYVDLQVRHALREDQFQRFLAACVPAEVPAGQVLVEAGDLDSSMLLLCEGEVELRVEGTRGAAVTAVLGRGGTLGAEALLGVAEQRTCGARTLTDCSVLILEREALAALRAEGHPVVANLETMALRASIARLRDLLADVSRLGQGEPPPAAMRTRKPSLLWRIGDVLGLTEPAEPDWPDEVAAMRTCPGLDDAPQEVLASLEARTRPAWYEVGMRLGTEGGEPEDPFLVVSGQVGRFRKGRGGLQVALGTLGAGGLGGAETVSEASWPPLSYIVLDDVVALRVPRVLCADAVVDRSPLSGALRRAMLVGVARAVDDATQVLAEQGIPAADPVRRLGRVG